MTKNRIIILGAVVFLAVVFLGIKSFSVEDEWICENGQWVAHGSPSEEKPIIGCLKNSGAVGDVSCQTNADCVCGLQKTRGVCTFGSRLFVNDSLSCGDFCASLEGVQAGCVKGECRILR